MMNHLPFGGGTSLALPPVDLATSPSTVWCKVKDVNEFLVFSVLADAGAAAAHPVFSLEQAKDSAGTDAITMGVKRAYWKKGTGAGGAFVNADDVYTEDTAVNVENPGASYDTSLHTPGAAQSVHAIMIRPIDLMEGYTHVRLNITCPGAKVACVAVDIIGKVYQSRQTPGPIEG